MQKLSKPMDKALENDDVEFFAEYADDIDALIEVGPDPVTIAWLAVNSRAIKILRFALDHGADWKFCRNGVYSFSLRGLYTGNIECLRVLFQYGMRPNSFDLVHLMKEPLESNVFWTDDKYLQAMQTVSFFTYRMIAAEPRTYGISNEEDVVKKLSSRP